MVSASQVGSLLTGTSRLCTRATFLERVVVVVVASEEQM